LTAPVTLTLTAEAMDLDGTVTCVEFYNGATLLTSAVSSPYSATWSISAAGVYTVTAIAYDELGANTVSAPIIATIVEPVAGQGSPEAPAGLRAYLPLVIQ
jgi:hypothetical protein